MKRHYCFVACVIAALVLPSLLVASEGDDSVNQQPGGDVTYIANEGFLVETAGKKVLIDAVFTSKFEKYAAPSPELLEQMIKGQAPFDKVDVLLITHRHADHMDPESVAAFMRHHPETVLVTHQQVVDLLRQAKDFAEYESRIRQVNLEFGECADFNINGIQIDLVCLYHAGGPKGATKNLAFSVGFGEFGFFHTGDAAFDQNIEELQAFPFERSKTDLLFMEYFDSSLNTREFIQSQIKPSHVVAMHIPPAEYEGIAKDFCSKYPAAVLFKESMEHRYFGLGDENISE